jgi:hypothetical protein
MERIEPSSVQGNAGPDPVAFSKAAPKLAMPDGAMRMRPEPGATADNPIDLPVATMERRASGGWAFALAAAFCVLWIGGLGGYAAGYAASPAARGMDAGWLAVFAAAVLAPCALALFCAALLREARNLRAQSRSIAAAAGALIRPDEQAARNVAKLGAAMRRELDQFNRAVDEAASRLAALQSGNAERLDVAGKAVAAAEARVDAAAQKLAAEREKLQGFSQSLEQAVSSVAETLNARVADARAAARAAAEGLDVEHKAIGALLEQLTSASGGAASRAAAMAQEFEKQSQRLESAAEAASARSDQVMQRHERHRAGLNETLERLKAENDNMTRALEAQRDGFSKLVAVMAEEAKRVDSFANDGVRRIDSAAAAISQRIVETAQTLANEIERLKTQSELSSSGIGQAVEIIKSAGDTSYENASRLGAQLSHLSESAARAAMQVDAGISKLQQFMADLPRDVTSHAEQLRGVVEGQALAINDLSGRIANAYDQLQALESQKLVKPGAPIAGPATAALAPPQNAQPPAAEASPQPAALPEPPPITQTASPPAELAVTAAPMLQSDAPAPAPKTHSPLTERIVNAPPPVAPAPDPTQGKTDAAAAQEFKGWLGIAKRLVRLGGPDESVAETPGPQRNWEMKQLLQAAEQAGQGESPAAVATRHAIESLQSLAIDIDRFLEDDPPLDYLRRYRAGERDIFARRLLQVISRDTAERLTRKYKNDAEFREAVDRYCTQFESMMADIQTGGGDAAKSEATLNAPVGKAYMALARISGRI